MAATSAPEGRQSLPDRLVGLGPKRWYQGLAAVALAITGLFGGLDRVDTAVTRIEPDAEFDDGALTVTVKRARLLPEVTAGERVLMSAAPGWQYLAVVTALANDGTEPVPLPDEIDLRNVETTGDVTVFRLADGSQTASLGPGLSGEFAYVWQLPATALRPGEGVSLRIWKKKYIELSVALGRGWIDSSTDYAEMELPVGERR
ncbi:MAG: hypothetical protein ACKOQ4_08535 [Mycobacterium sp.]